MARKSARAAAVQMVFENMLGGDGGEETLRGLIEFTPEEDDQAYIDGILAGVEENAERLDGIIEQCLKGWTLDRIAKVDRAVLRVAAYELCFARETPDAVDAGSHHGLHDQDGDEHTPELRRLHRG